MSDTVEGFIRAAVVPGIEGDIFQLGTGETISVAELFTACCEILAVEADVETDKRRLRPQASEVMVLQSNPSKARSVLKWTPRVSVRDGIEQTVNWLRENLEEYDAEQYHI